MPFIAIKISWNLMVRKPRNLRSLPRPEQRLPGVGCPSSLPEKSFGAGYNIHWGYNIILYIYMCILCILYIYIYLCIYIIYIWIYIIYIWIYGGSCGENGDNFMEYSGWWFRSSTCFKCVCLPSDDHPSQLTKASPRVVQAPPDGISDFLEERYSDYRDDVFTLLELINSSSLVLPSMLGLQKQPVAALNTLEISFQPSPQHWHFHTYHT